MDNDRPELVPDEGGLWKYNTSDVHKYDGRCRDCHRGMTGVAGKYDVKGVYVRCRECERLVFCKPKR